MELTDCLFDGNGAWFSGGAVDCHVVSIQIDNCTFSDNMSQGGAICVSESGIALNNSIIAFTSEGMGANCWDSNSISISCTDIYGNEGGDWVGAIAGFFGDDNISVDPLFCGEANPEEPFTLYAHSPGALENNPGCGLIGAFDVGCTAGCEPGNADGKDGINIVDASYLVNYLYKDGPPAVPYEVCSGDPDASCTVDLQDVTYIINFLYKSGPDPATGDEWSDQCGP